MSHDFPGLGRYPYPGPSLFILSHHDFTDESLPPPRPSSARKVSKIQKLPRVSSLIKKLASRISNKHKDKYAEVINFLRTRIRFCLLRNSSRLTLHTVTPFLSPAASLRLLESDANRCWGYYINLQVQLLQLFLVTCSKYSLAGLFKLWVGDLLRPTLRDILTGWFQFTYKYSIGVVSNTLFRIFALPQLSGIITRDMIIYSHHKCILEWSLKRMYWGLQRMPIINGCL
eukprot:sb/3469498/